MAFVHCKPDGRLSDIKNPARAGVKLVAGLDLNQGSREADYEPDELHNPVSLRKPAPPFCCLSRFSSLRASESVSDSLVPNQRPWSTMSRPL